MAVECCMYIYIICIVTYLLPTADNKSLLGEDRVIGLIVDRR